MHRATCHPLRPEEREAESRREESIRRCISSICGMIAVSHRDLPPVSVVIILRAALRRLNSTWQIFITTTAAVVVNSQVSPHLFCCASRPTTTLAAAS